MVYKRQLLFGLRVAHSSPTSIIHVLIGPRRVGKTTITRQIQESVDFPAIYATADSPVPLDTAWIETQWRRVVAESNAVNKPVLLILDEIQKVRGWREPLKILWDSRQN